MMASPRLIRNLALSANRSCASIRNSNSSRSPCRSTLYFPSSCRPSARGGAGGSQCRPCGQHLALLHSSIRARYPSDELPFHPYLQSRAVSLDPLTRIRDLPWPRLPPPVRGLFPWVSKSRWRPRCRRPRAQPVQPGCQYSRGLNPEVIDLVRLTGVNRMGTCRVHYCLIAAVCCPLPRAECNDSLHSAELLPQLGKTLLSRRRCHTFHQNRGGCSGLLLREEIQHITHARCHAFRAHELEHVEEPGTHCPSGNGHTCRMDQSRRFDAS